MDDDGSVLRVEQGAQPRGNTAVKNCWPQGLLRVTEAPRHNQSGQLCSRSAPAYLIKRANPARGYYCMRDEWLGL